MPPRVFEYDGLVADHNPPSELVISLKSFHDPHWNPLNLEELHICSGEGPSTQASECTCAHK